MSLFRDLPQQSYTFDFYGVSFISRNAAQEFVSQVNRLKQNGFSAKITNTNPEIAAFLQSATKSNKAVNWLFVSGVLVAAGLLYQFISKPNSVKKALKEF